MLPLQAGIAELGSKGLDCATSPFRPPTGALKSEGGPIGPPPRAESPPSSTACTSPTAEVGATLSQDVKTGPAEEASAPVDNNGGGSAMRVSSVSCSADPGNNDATGGRSPIMGCRPIIQSRQISTQTADPQISISPSTSLQHGYTFHRPWPLRRALLFPQCCNK